MPRYNKKPPYHVEQVYWEKAVRGMDDELQRLQLQWNKGQISPAIRTILKKKDYEKHFRGIVR